MGSKFLTFMIRMDRLHWLRLLVCVLPGLIIGKLSALPGSPPVIRMLASIVLAIGFSAYLGWGWIRKRLLEAQRDEETVDGGELEQEPTFEIPNVAPAIDYINRLSELHKMCGGDPDAVTKLLTTEASIHPDWPLPAVIEEAHRRRSYAFRSQSGSST